MTRGVSPSRAANPGRRGERQEGCALRRTERLRQRGSGRLELAALHERHAGSGASERGAERRLQLGQLSHTLTRLERGGDDDRLCLPALSARQSGTSKGRYERPCGAFTSASGTPACSTSRQTGSTRAARHKGTHAAQADLLRHKRPCAHSPSDRLLEHQRHGS